MNIQLDRFYTVDEVSGILRMSPRFVRQLCSSGQLVAVGGRRVGYRVLGEAILDYGRRVVLIRKT
jgi:hypothetical protein